MVLGAIGKLLVYGGVTLVAGDLLLELCRPAHARAPRDVHLRSLVRAGWMMLGAGSASLLLAQVVELELDMTVESFSALLGSDWGVAWILLVLSVLLGAWSFARRWRPGSRALLLIPLAVCIGGLGHAAADVEWPRLSRVLDALHVIAVGGWIGGLCLLSRLDPSETSNETWVAFSRYATMLAPLVLISGVLASLLRLNDATFFAALSSQYGRLLLLKVALASVVLALGAMHHKRIVNAGIPRASSVRFELAIAALVFITTSVLTGTAPPGE